MWRLVRRQVRTHMWELVLGVCCAIFYVHITSPNRYDLPQIPEKLDIDKRHVRSNVQHVPKVQQHVNLQEAEEEEYDENEVVPVNIEKEDLEEDKFGDDEFFQVFGQPDDRFSKNKTERAARLKQLEEAELKEAQARKPAKVSIPLVEKPEEENKVPYIVEPKNICKAKDPLLVIYILTESDRYKRRAIIRQTWGDLQHYKPFQAQLVFVVANMSHLPMLQNAVANEAGQFQDILQVDIVESAKNQGHKNVAALRWLALNCPKAKYVLKVEEHMLVNMYSLLNHLHQLYEANFNTDFLMCMVNHKRPVKRDGPNAVAVEDYPEKSFPPSCAPNAYIMSGDMPGKLTQAANKVKYVWLDDLFVTGLLPAYLGIKLKTCSNLFIGIHEVEEIFTHTTEWYKYIFSNIPDHMDNLMIGLWPKMSALAKPNGKIVIPTPRSSIVIPGKPYDTVLPKEQVVKNPNAPYNKKKQKKTQSN